MVYTVIMAGGSGTRFWPASRRALPKQFLPLGDGVTPLLTATIRRVAALSGPGEVIVVTRADLAEATRSAAPELVFAHCPLRPCGASRPATFFSPLALQNRRRRQTSRTLP